MSTVEVSTIAETCLLPLFCPPSKISVCYFVSLDNKTIKAILWATFYTLARVSNSFIMLADCPLINTRCTFKGYLFTTTSLFVTVRCEHNRQRSVGSSDSSERLLPLHVSLSASREVRGATERTYVRRDGSSPFHFRLRWAEELVLAW